MMKTSFFPLIKSLWAKKQRAFCLLVRMIFCPMKSLSSRRRWVTAAKYAIDKLPVDNDFLKNLSWISPYNQTSCLKQATREEEKTEFMDYCTAELPPENAATNESDFYGHKVGQVKNVTGQIHCGLLSKLAKAVATSNSLQFTPIL